MNSYYNLSDEQKRHVLLRTEEQIHLSAQAVEKDLWVTCLLQILFSLDLSAHIIFKGGTSLSKFGNLIDRFSEDIDIAIDPAVYGMSVEPTIVLEVGSRSLMEPTVSLQIHSLIETHFPTIQTSLATPAIITLPLLLKLLSRRHVCCMSCSPWSGNIYLPITAAVTCTTWSV